jgi:hypothetical protein
LWLDAGHSGLPEYIVAADAAPDDVRIALANLLAELEGGSIVGTPGHLPDARVSRDPLHAQARPEPPLLEVLYKLRQHRTEPGLTRGSKLRKVAGEAGVLRVCRHLSVRNCRFESGGERLVTGEYASAWSRRWRRRPTSLAFDFEMAVGKERDGDFFTAFGNQAHD